MNILQLTNEQQCAFSANLISCNLGKPFHDDDYQRLATGVLQYIGRGIGTSWNVGGWARGGRKQG